MKRSLSKIWGARPCWPLFRKKCEACGRKFRWERGIKWQRVPGVAESTRYLCANCKPSSRVTTRDGVERWVKYLKQICQIRPPKMPNCRCVTMREAAKNLARVSQLRVRLEDIHIPRQNKKEPA